MAPVPLRDHFYACEGPPNGSCPLGRKGSKDDVIYNHHMKWICSDCSVVHDRVNAGELPSSNDSSCVLTRSKTSLRVSLPDENLGCDDKTILATDGSGDPARSADVNLDGNDITTPVTEGSTDAPSDGDDVDDVAAVRRPDGGDVIFDPMLTYIAHSLLSSSQDAVRSAVLGHFSTGQVKIARSLLWAYCPHAVIGPLKKRRATTARTVKEAHVMDILEAFQKLDNADKVPTVAVLSTDLNVMPRAHPEEAMPISAMDRMNHLERQIANLTGIMEHVVSENAMFRSEIENMKTSRRGTHDGLVSGGVDIPLPNVLPKGVDQQSVAPKKHKKKKKSPIIPDIPGAQTLFGPELEMPMETMETMLDVGPEQRIDPVNDENHKFNLVVSRNNLRKENAKLRTTNHVVGTGNKFKSLTGANPLRHLFVYGVSTETTIDDIREFITSFHNIDLKFIEKLQPSAKRTPGSTSQSFQVTVSVADYELLSKPESWPGGIRVRRFFPVRGGKS